MNQTIRDRTRDKEYEERRAIDAEMTAKKRTQKPQEKSFLKDLVEGFKTTMNIAGMVARLGGDMEAGETAEDMAADIFLGAGRGGKPAPTLFVDKVGGDGKKNKTRAATLSRNEFMKYFTSAIDATAQEHLKKTRQEGFKFILNTAYTACKENNNFAEHEATEVIGLLKSYALRKYNLKPATAKVMTIS
ncbi:MAG: hypothetical protein FWC00_03795 [Firmicutes bacterium]|nr:hypothetical protein [Bacillota bacterium]